MPFADQGGTYSCQQGKQFVDFIVTGVFPVYNLLSFAKRLLLKDEATLTKRGITCDFGYIKNKNANSVIDKGIQEFAHELYKVDSSGGPIIILQLQMVRNIKNLY